MHMKFDYSVTPIYRKDDFAKIKIDEFKPLVSIITPFYNSGEFIKDTALSVLNQTFPWFEWIIVDDGSKDKKSLDILSKIEKSDNRIKVYHKENEGLAATRDFGAKKASKDSKYFLFLDDDDLIETNYIECSYYALETNPKAAFSYTNTVGFGEEEYLWDKKFNIKTEIKENLLVATALIRKEDFFSVGGYGTKEKGINEDWIFWLKLFSKAKTPLKLNYYGFWYRRKKVGELQKSKSNKEKTYELMRPYIKNIDLDLKSLEYPKDEYDWNETFNLNNTFKVHSKIASNKTNILMIMPHIVMGGADKFNIDFLKGLKKKYSVTAIFTNISDNEWLSEIKKYVDSYYILPSFLERKYWHQFLEYLIKKNSTKLIFNTNSIYGYMVLPYLKNKFNNIRIMDYIHMEEWYNRNGGYSRDSSAVASVIDKTLVCNRNSENILVDFFKRNSNEIETVYIGVDENKFNNNFSKKQIIDLKNKYGIPSNKKIITFIARIADQKRPFLLAEIIKLYAKKHDNSLFVICGDGPLLQPLKDVIDKNQLQDYVIFLGSIKNTKEIYAISDCTLNCSIKEGLALTTYESLSMGVPVVSSKVGGQAEIIDDTVGFVIETKQLEKDVLDYNYDEEEIESFVKSLEKILRKNKYYKSNCRNKILSGFTIDQMNKKMNKIIDRLLVKDNSKKFENEDVSKELLNQYLLESKELYDYDIMKFNMKYECSCINKENYGVLKFILFNIKDVSKKVAIKLHIYKETRILFIIFKSLLKTIVFAILLPITIIKRILTIIAKAIKKIIWR